MRISVEHKESAEGLLFRWKCDCGRFGIWLLNRHNAERNGDVHRVTTHPTRSAA